MHVSAYECTQFDTNCLVQQLERNRLKHCAFVNIALWLFSINRFFDSNSIQMKHLWLSCWTTSKKPRCHCWHRPTAVHSIGQLPKIENACTASVRLLKSHFQFIQQNRLILLLSSHRILNGCRAIPHNYFYPAILVCHKTLIFCSPRAIWNVNNLR